MPAERQGAAGSPPVVGAIVAAAGASRRMSGDDKIFASLRGGR